MSKFTFSKTNLSKYCIVYPKYNMSYLVTLELEKLRKAAKKITGKDMNMYPDNKEYAYEIVVDEASREQSPMVYDNDTYIISPLDKKIFIKGGRPCSTVAGLKRFIKLLKKGEPITDTIIGSYEKDKKGFGNDYRLTWGDDFDTENIDESKWEIYYEKKLCYCEGLNGKQTKRCRKDPPNTYQKDGKLFICATETEDSYYGGMLCTQGTMRYKYGFIEISTMHPKGAGFGLPFGLTATRVKTAIGMPK